MADKSVSELNNATSTKDQDLYLVSQKNELGKYESKKIDWSSIKNNIKTFLQGFFVRTDGTAQNVAGSKTFTGTFEYSAIEEANQNAYRTIWFSDNTKKGKPVYDNDFKYNPNTNVLDVKTLKTGVKLENSPADTASGHEIVDAAWINQKIMDLDLYKPPQTLNSIRVYLSPNGNDTTALKAFNDMLKSSNITDQTKLADTPFKTVSSAISALGHVRSTRNGFTYYILALPGTYTIGVNATDNIYKTVTLRHPDCNIFSGSKLILAGVHDKTGTTIAERGEVKFKFPSVQTYTGSKYGVQHACFSLVNASIENICFYQDGLTFNDNGEVEYDNPCDCSQISYGSSYLLSAPLGNNSIYNCECYAKPIQDNNIWRSWVFLLVHEDAKCDVSCTSDKYYRHEVFKDGGKVIEGHRCCFYGLYSVFNVTEGKILTNWKTFDYYFHNCSKILDIGDSNEMRSEVIHWINHIGNPLTYQAWELDNVRFMYDIKNNTSISFTNDEFGKYIEGLYNPLKSGYLSTIVVKNSPQFQFSNVDVFNEKINNGQTHNLIVRTDYNKLFRFHSYYEHIQ